MTKILYTVYCDFENMYFLYKYRDNVCVRVFDNGSWVDTEMESRFPQEVDIPDSAVLLFAGGLP